MKKLIIYGTAKLSALVFHSIQRAGTFEVVAFAADKAYLDGQDFCDRPVIDFELIDSNYPVESYQMLVVGPYGSATVRQSMCEAAKRKGYKLVNFIDPQAIVADDCVFGVNNIVLGGTYIDCLGHMGDGNIFRPNVYLGHDFSVGNFNYFAPGVNVAGYSQIGDFCFLGIGATVIENKTIASGTTLGAQALLVKDTEENSLYVGVPAKKREKQGVGQ